MQRKNPSKGNAINRRKIAKGHKLPPTIPSLVKVGHTFRFVNSSNATNTPCSGADLLGLLAVATSATGVSSIISGIKIKSVECWASTSANAVTVPSVTWVGYAYREPKRMTDTAIDSTTPGHVYSVPPKDSDCGKWISSLNYTSTTLFNISASAGTVIDLRVTLVLANSTTFGTPVTYVSSGLSLGKLYYGELDFNSAAAKFIPVDVAYYG